MAETVSLLYNLLGIGCLHPVDPYINPTLQGSIWNVPLRTSFALRLLTRKEYLRNTGKKC
jgi:hypothetical protein